MDGSHVGALGGIAVTGQGPRGVTPRPPLSSGPLAARLLLIVLILGGLVGAFAWASGWLIPAALTPARFVDRFEHVNGLFPGFRRNHAKGVCFAGTFESNGQGAALSKAVVFRPGVTPVMGRFALAGGKPFMHDDPKTVRSMALLFKLANGEEWRAGINNIPVFPFSTPQAFYENLLAGAPEPQTGKPDPARLADFLAAHPETAAALKLIGAREISSGFHDAAYHSLNAFIFTNDAGVSVPVRWSMVPLQPVEPVSAADEPLDANALFDALIAAVHRGPQRWRLMVTAGESGDPTRDSTLPWPAERRQVDVGTLTIDRIESEATSPVRDITFDPLILPHGISPSDDPILSARSATYARSFTRREGEPKQSSAVTPKEVGR